MVTRSGSTSSLVGSSAKRSRDDLTKHDDGEIVSLDDLWNKMQSMLRTTSERIETKIESCNAALEKRMSNIEDKLTAVREECSDKVAKLEDAIADVCADVDLAAEAACRIEKNRDLVFSGIPYQSREDLSDIFRKIAVSIGFDENNLPIVCLRRMTRGPISSGASPLILCEFSLRQERNEFYRQYLSKRSLCLQNIGFESANRVYINENLTSNARQIRAEAIKLRKSGQLENVTTRNGVVFVKRKGSEAASAIYSLQQIAPRSKTLTS